MLAVAGSAVESADASALRNLDLLGLAALIDPVCGRVPEAIEQCHNAGVGVRMARGDHPDPAFAIGRELKLAEGPGRVLTGSALDEAANDAAERISRARVFARAEPLQKTQTVESLQEAGHFVAVTVDCVNDASTLDRANIGIAMAEVGTDVARKAAI